MPKPDQIVFVNFLVDYAASILVIAAESALQVILRRLVGPPPPPVAVQIPFLGNKQLWESYRLATKKHIFSSRNSQSAQQITHDDSKAHFFQPHHHIRVLYCLCVISQLGNSNCLDPSECIGRDLHISYVSKHFPVHFGWTDHS